MGQLYCHTKPPSESRCVTVHPDQCSLQSYRLQTIKRFAQMLISRRRTFPLSGRKLSPRGGSKKTETDARSVSCPCRKSCSGGRSAVSKKPKREVRHAKQASDRPGVAAAPPASREPASATIIWIAPFAQNLRCHSDADAVRGQ